MNRSIAGIGYNCNLSPPLLLFNILEHMCLTNFSDDSNPPLNTVQLMVSKVFMFHENTELLPSGDCYDLSLVNNEPVEHITLIIFGIPINNKLHWVEVAKEDWAWGTNTSYLFSQSVLNVRHCWLLFKRKIVLAAPNIMYLNTYKIFFQCPSVRLFSKR